MASAARPISSEVVGNRPLISPDVQVAALAEAIGMKVGFVGLALVENFSEKLQLFL